MKLSNHTNRIFGKDWLRYHPYNHITYIDNYYITLCNKVLYIIQQFKISQYIGDPEEEKSLACVLVAYFEDVISETRLFSSFTRQHKKMYEKELPFYETSDDYDEDEINIRDIYFLIWYHITIYNEDILYDPYFENSQAFNTAVTKIYSLFNNEFEKAPQNEEFQNFLQLSANSSVMTVREILSFIACKSFLLNAVFDVFYKEVIEDYKKNGVVVLDEQAEIKIYDQEIHFIFNKYMPLLSMRVNEYFAEILGEEHSEYQFIKNISKRIFGCFVLRKIEENGFLIEHLTSKKQLWLSNEFTSLQNTKLVENETVLSIGLVNWKDDVWQNQGGCFVNTIHELNGKDFSEHFFDDEEKKKNFLEKFEKAYLKLTNGERIIFIRGKRAFIEFYLSLVRQHTKIIDPKIKDEELDEKYKNFFQDSEKDLDFKKNEILSIFFNPKSGIEILREGVTLCMSDKNNPYYAQEEFELCDLLTNKSFSKEFVNYVIENEIINLNMKGDKNPDTYKIFMENFDFLLRFFRGSSYFSKPEVTIQ